MREQQRKELINLERDGRLRPSIVVDTARDEDSPLHSEFTWDDTEAAELHRREEARRLIRSFQIPIVSRGKTVIMTPQFLHDPRLPSGQEGYVASVRLRNDADAAREAILSECGVIRGAILRMQAVIIALNAEDDAEVAGAMTAINVLRRRFDSRDDSAAGHA